jgi:hypothetical protein
MCRLAKVRWLGLALLLVGGCRSNEVNVKPAKAPEQFVVPPDSPRFTNNIEYPKDTLFTDVIQKDPSAAGGSGGGRGGPGGGGGGVSPAGGVGRPGY